MTTNYIGEPISRVDGRAKVTGEAKYAGEHNVPNRAYGFVVSSTIAKGKITNIDTSQALAVKGVVDVLTHLNTPRLTASDDDFRDEAAPPGSPLRLPSSFRAARSLMSVLRWVVSRTSRGGTNKPRRC